MEIPDGLELRESSIHGLGIFTTREFSAGYNFGEFVGEEMAWGEFKLRYGKDYRYCYKMMRAHKIIVAKEKRNWITFINSGTPNVILKKKCCFALRSLKAGDELLLDYGRLYPPYHTILETKKYPTLGRVVWE